LTLYLVVHLTDSTTLTAHIYLVVLHFLAPYQLRGPITILPGPLPSGHGFKDTSHLDQLPNCTNSILPLLLQRRRTPKLPCTGDGVRELLDGWPPPYIPARGGIFRQLDAPHEHRVGSCMPGKSDSPTFPSP
ncbi:hypothetical protein K443DRAFT_327238, partial [Laccaria amethystina LaAM-08-1]